MDNQKQKTEEPHIKIFNQEVNSPEEGEKESKINICQNCEKDCHHHKHRGGSIFGLLILFIGVFALLNNLGVVSRDIWRYILPFWPVLLILAGIKIIIGTSRIARFFYFIIGLVLLSYVFMNAWINISLQNPGIELPPGVVNFTIN